MSLGSHFTPHNRDDMGSNSHDISLFVWTREVLNAVIHILHFVSITKNKYEIEMRKRKQFSNNSSIYVLYILVKIKQKD